MTDLSLIERLRVDSLTFVRDWDATIALLNEAASALESQQERIAELQKQWADSHSSAMQSGARVAMQQERIAELLRARDESTSLITAERERMDALVEKQAATIAVLTEALEEIEWHCEGRVDIDEHGGPNIEMVCSSIARDALAKVEGEVK